MTYIKQIEESASKFKDLGLQQQVFDMEKQYAMQALQNNDFLRQTAEANPKSLLDAMVNLAMSGLTLHPSAKEAFLVPRDKKVVFEPGYRGFIRILTSFQGSLVSKIESGIVYEKELEQGRFVVRKGTNPSIDHDPIIVGDRGPIVATYAVAFLKDGSTQFEIINKTDLDRIKSKSAGVASGKFSPYTDWEAEMYRKAPIRRLWGFLPKPNLPLSVLAALESDIAANRVADEPKQTAVHEVVAAVVQQQPKIALPEPPKDFADAMRMVNDCKTVDEINAVFRSCSDAIKRDPVFINECKVQKEKLTIK